jgi:hypothetical protein
MACYEAEAEADGFGFRRVMHLKKRTPAEAGVSPTRFSSVPVEFL